jgi:hypothetical protein
MSVDTSEISAPPADAAADTEEKKAAKTEKTPFTGDYVPDANGRMTFMVTFPAEALNIENFRPVEGLILLAESCGLKGYGPGDAPQATVGTERAKVKGPNGEMVANPKAGQPNGSIHLVLHTEKSLVEARKRGRTATSEPVKKAVSAVSGLIKSALSRPGNEEAVIEIAAKAERGEIDLATALAQIQALM